MATEPLSALERIHRSADLMNRIDHLRSNAIGALSMYESFTAEADGLRAELRDLNALAETQGGAA